MRARILVLISPVLGLAGCADTGASYRPILDGTPGQTYQTDLVSCQSLAEQQSYDEDIIGAILAGAVFGGATGGHEDDIGGMEAAAAGALFGWLGAIFDRTDQQESIVVECMRGRGHRVVG